MPSRTTKTPAGSNGDGPSATDPNLVTASSALVQLGDDDTARAIELGMSTMSEQAKGQLVDRLLTPDQKVTNEIWGWIVRTFAIVLVLAAAALVTAVIVSFWHKADAAMIQIVLTVFTTTAGILGGFISGRMSARTT